jgi:hypothetical protein
MERGYIDLDAMGCAAVLNGYISYLESTPISACLILDDLSALHQNNAGISRRIKALVSITGWPGTGDDPFRSAHVCASFRRIFDRLWAQGAALSAAVRM